MLVLAEVVRSIKSAVGVKDKRLFFQFIGYAYTGLCII
jgi:hypothetical protein